jgi:hypothetical protein
LQRHARFYAVLWPGIFQVKIFTSMAVRIQL